MRRLKVSRFLPLAAFLLNVLLLPPRIQAQSKASFEVASIKPNKDRGSESLAVNPGGIIYSHLSFRRCIEAAYGVKSYQIAGPDWMDFERFDIVARSAEPATSDQLMAMLQTLLADRFKLALHMEKKELPVYALRVGKSGARLNASRSDGNFSIHPASGGIGFQNISMSDFASQFLSRMGPIGRPVLDMTGLDGKYDFTLKLFAGSDPEGAANAKLRAAESGPDFFMDALDALGLKLEAQKAVLDMLVVDFAEKVPTEN